MTREEAIEKIENLDNCYNQLSDDDKEALDMAMEALKQESVLDKIRTEITNTLYVDSLIFGELIDFKNGKISVDDVIEEFNKISREEVINIIDKYLAENSEQEPKKGHWIRITNGAMKEKYICSECGRQIEDDGIEGLLPIKYPYCHCGAKMQEVEE